MITITDITIGAKFQIQTGSIFIIDRIENTTVHTSLEGGAKGNYKDDIADCVQFLNEEKAIKL